LHLIWNIVATSLLGMAFPIFAINGNGNCLFS